jgi:hypothetical protein
MTTAVFLGVYLLCCERVSQIVKEPRYFFDLDGITANRSERYSYRAGAGVWSMTAVLAKARRFLEAFLSCS